MSRALNQSIIAAAILISGIALGWWLADTGIRRPMIVRPVERVTIAEGPIAFLARLDSGAQVSSINARDIEVIGGDPRDPPANLGKRVRFTLVNADGTRAPLEAPIRLVRPIITADCREWRYHVYLNVEFRGRRHEVLVNLNDRSHKRERLLLGRNWLRHAYVIDMRRHART